MALIYHLTTRIKWQCNRSDQHYFGDLSSIKAALHCYDENQITRLRDTFFTQQTDMMILTVDTDLLDAELRYENTSGGEELYPYIYGPINFKAIVNEEAHQADLLNTLKF